jgi:tetratricopeptide (TPR) repeat protein
MSGAAPEGTGSLSAALAHTRRLLGSSPALAEAQAREILKAAPRHPEATCLLGAALRAKGDAPAALGILRPLAEAYPRDAAVNYELGLALGDLGESRSAIAALKRAGALDSRHTQAWRALGDQHLLVGDNSAADAAYARHIAASVNNPVLLEAGAALCENRLAIAERLLRAYLKVQPTDVAAIRMLAETGIRLGRLEDAEKLLARVMELAPGFVEARHNYAVVLHRQNKPEAALAELDTLLVRDPRNPNYRGLQAAVFGRIGEYERAIACYESLLRDFPVQPKAWMSYGHALKTVGRTEEAIAAYRRSIADLASLGEAYWSLANLKTFRFSDAEVEAMRTQLARADLDEEDRTHLHFALGKALEDADNYEESFAEYARGNALRHQALRYDANEISAIVQRSKALFTPAFFAEREGWGSPARDPIFIVGLTRSGSTLIEQILASHSAVEGTMELPDIPSLARRFGERGKERDDETRYPAGLASLSAEECRALGDEYLARTRIQRKLDRPFFVDKMPNNWAHVGLIHLILPNARIVDARRHPLACGFSNFKQLYARGQGFSYGLADFARYYRDYAGLMAHFDAVLPGRVHRVLYEAMVVDPEGEIRRLLAYCGLPFEPQCLRFYENERAVRTASSEQVRRPISARGLEQWRHFEPWLGEMKAELGAILESYPAVPQAIV